MTDCIIPVDNYAWTPTGAVLVEQVEPGHELIVVERDGTLATQSVLAVREVTERKPSVRLLTGSGDLEVLLDTIIMTRTGPRRVAEIVSEVRSGRSEKLELIRPVDLPRSLDNADVAACASAALGRLGGVVHIPWPVAADETAFAKIRDVVRAAEAEYHEAEVGRWLVITCTARATAAKLSSPSELASAAKMLAVLTAWELDSSGWQSRLPLDDVATRSVILAGLSSSAEDFRTYWSPLYWPVEFRISRSTAPGSHWDIRAVTPSLGGGQRVLALDAGRETSLVLGRALVRT